MQLFFVSTGHFEGVRKKETAEEPEMYIRFSIIQNPQKNPSKNARSIDRAHLIISILRGLPVLKNIIILKPSQGYNVYIINNQKVNVL